jgi:outer membrane protein OmpA-like peptidoglycan-associated protein
MKTNVRNMAFAAIAAAVAACSPSANNPGATTPAASASATPAAATSVSPPPASVSSAPVKAGGTIEQAAASSVGASIDGEILKTDQNDFYRFDNPLKQRDLAIVRLQNKSTTLKPDFKLFNADRSQGPESYDGTPGASVERTISLEPGQAFYVGVMNYGSTGKYTLSVTPQKAFDSHEPNDDVLTATSVAIGTTIDASIMDDKDQDWYRISGATQKTIHVTFDNQSTTLKPDVKMYSASKSGIGEKYDGTPGANLDFSFDVEPGKDFYLQVLPYSTTGKYRLTIKPEPGQPAAPASPPAAAAAPEPAPAPAAAPAPVNAAAMTNDLASTGQVTLYGIYFDFDKADIKPESKGQIDEIAKLLTASANLKLRVIGYTDNKGTADHNLKLSQRRADAIVAVLVKDYGVAGNRLSASGVGSAAPVASNDTEEGRAKNRRVELLKL